MGSITITIMNKDLKEMRWFSINATVAMPLTDMRASGGKLKPVLLPGN